MKKTEYFLSAMTHYDSASNALQEVIKKRDNYLTQNIEVIGEIEEENVSIFRVHTGFVQALLKLTYYPKE